MSGGVVGCELSGPPPASGGSISEISGDSDGGGISVPSVREYSMGATVRIVDFSSSLRVLAGISILLEVDLSGNQPAFNQPVFCNCAGL